MQSRTGQFARVLKIQVRKTGQNPTINLHLPRPNSKDPVNPHYTQLTAANFSNAE